MISLTIKDNAFKADMKRFMQKSDKQFKHAVNDSTNQLVKRAKLNVRNQTMNSKTKRGNLQRSITPQIQNNGLTGVVTSKASYSKAYEDGTRPHDIRIKNKRVLAGPYRGRPAGWKVNKSSRSMGFATYGKKVHHPGTKAHPFMKPAFSYVVNYFNKKIKEALK